jgi:fibronectin-binding autotransporter adhesin
MRRFSVSAALVSVFLLASPLVAASFTWNGAIGDSWNEAGNWLEGVVPGVNDDVTFNASTLIHQIAQLGGDQAIHSIIFNNYANSSITIAAGGTLSIGSGGITLTATTAPSHKIDADLNLTSPQTWNIATSKTLTCNGTISGTGGLTKSGNGVLALGAANSLSGVVRITAGQIRLNDSNALQNCMIDMASADAGTLTFGSAGEYIFGGLTGSRNILFPAGFTLSVGSNNLTTTYTGVLGNNGAGNFKKIGSGTLILTNPQAFTGTTRLVGGILRVAANSLQSSTLDMQADDAGTLESRDSGPLTLGGLQGTRGLAFSSTLSGLNIGYNNTNTTYSGSLSGSAGVLQKIGSGTLVLAGDNTVTAIVRIAKGTLEISHPNALQNCILDMGTTDTGTLSLTPGSEYILGGLTGGRNIGIPANTVLAVGNNNLTTTYTADLTGAGTLKKIGSGTFVLNNVCSLWGTVRPAGGVLRVNSTSFPNATLDMQEGDSGTIESNNGGTLILGGLQGTRGLAFSANLIGLSVGDNDQDTTYSGSLSGTNGVFEKIGTGTLTLAGDNSFSGFARLTRGKLRLAHANALRNATLELTMANPGMVEFIPGSEYTLGGLTGDWAVSIPSDTTLAIGNNNLSTSFTGTISGAGTLKKVGSGTLYVNNNYTSIATVRPAAGILQIFPYYSLEDSTIDLRMGDTGRIEPNGGGTLTLGALTGDRDLAFSSSLMGIDVGHNNADTTYSGAFTGTSGVLQKIGTGTLTLAGASTFSGATRVLTGKLVLSNPNALQNSVLDMGSSSSTGVLQLCPAAENALGGLMGSRSLEIPAGVTLAIGGAGVSYGGILTGAGDLKKIRAGSQVFTGSGEFTGTTRLVAGTLQVGSNTLQNSTLDLDAADSGVLQLAQTMGGTITLGGLRGSRDFKVTNASLYVLNVGKNNADTTYSGAISTNAVVLSFAKVGSGNLTLSGVNSFSGPVRVTAGTLTLANRNALWNSVLDLNYADLGTVELMPGVENNVAGLTGTRNLNIPADTTLRVANAGAIGYGGVLGGDGNLIKAGNGTFSLGGCELTGTVRVAAGVLKVGSDSLKKTTLDLRAEDAGTIDSSGALASVGVLRGSRDLTFGSSALRGLSIGYLDTDCTYSGAFHGIGMLEKVGLGRLTLTGDSNFSGPCSIVDGIVQVDGTIPFAHLSAFSTISGIGTVGSVFVEADGRVAPGDSGPGTLHVGELGLFSGAKLDYDLGSTEASDLISMPVAALTLGGTQFADFTFNPLDGFGPGTYVLIDAGSISGDLGELRSGTIGGNWAEISIVGNDVVLTVVPEPSTLALLAMALLGSAYFVRRRE